MTTAEIRANEALSPWLVLGVPAAAALGLYAPLVPALVGEWVEFPTLSHGFAIPFIAAYLVWARRERLRTLPLEPCLWALPVLVVGLGGLVLGGLGEEPFLARMSFPVTLFGLTLVLVGPRVTREAWMGLAYLVFMVPPPWSTLKLVTYRSRLFDAAASAEALGWLGVPVLLDGVLLHLPNITLEVADACSSIPAIAALLALGIAYASLVRRPLVVRLAIVLTALPLAITANIVRIISVSALAYYVGPWTLKTAYHMFNGTVNFLFTFVLLLLLDAGLTRVMEMRRR